MPIHWAFHNLSARKVSTGWLWTRLENNKQEMANSVKKHFIVLGNCLFGLIDLAYKMVFAAHCFDIPKIRTGYD